MPMEIEELHGDVQMPDADEVEAVGRRLALAQPDRWLMWRGRWTSVSPLAEAGMTAEFAAGLAQLAQGRIPCPSSTVKLGLRRPST
jgi:hypothetical protein